MSNCITCLLRIRRIFCKWKVLSSFVLIFFLDCISVIDAVIILLRGASERVHGSRAKCMTSCLVLPSLLLAAKSRTYWLAVPDA